MFTKPRIVQMENWNLKCWKKGDWTHYWFKCHRKNLRKFQNIWNWNKIRNSIKPNSLQINSSVWGLADMAWCNTTMKDTKGKEENKDVCEWKGDKYVISFWKQPTSFLSNKYLQNILKINEESQSCYRSLYGMLQLIFLLYKWLLRPG